MRLAATLLLVLSLSACASPPPEAEAPSDPNAALPTPANDTCGAGAGNVSVLRYYANGATGGSPPGPFHAAQQSAATYTASPSVATALPEAPPLPRKACHA